VRGMAGPRDATDVSAHPGAVRAPAVAGMFYPSDAARCREMAESYLRAKASAAGELAWRGAIVPHAGWVCSGAIAGEAIATVAASRAKAEVVVVFGAIHTPLPVEVAVFDTHARWRVPGGEAEVAGEVQRRLEEEASLFVEDERFHSREHAVEVELPLVRLAWPQAAVLPVEVPVVEDAEAIGVRTAKAIEAAGLEAVYLASSDMTHYGPGYRFTPAGVGVGALEWAKGNDRRLLGLVEEMAVERVVPEVRGRHNACGGGAIAACMAACREGGASRGRVLTHAHSYETLARVAPQPAENAVGYAGVVIG